MSNIVIKISTNLLYFTEDASRYQPACEAEVAAAVLGEASLAFVFAVAYFEYSAWVAPVVDQVGPPGLYFVFSFPVADQEYPYSYFGDLYFLVSSAADQLYYPDFHFEVLFYSVD